MRNTNFFPHLFTNISINQTSGERGEGGALVKLFSFFFLWGGGGDFVLV